VIITQTDEWIALNKPSQIHSVRSDKTGEPSMEDWLTEKFPQQKNLPEGGLVHRLDFLTSGVLLAARTQERFTNLKEQMASHTMDKIYWAAIEGAPTVDHFDFYFSSRYKRSKKVTVEPSGKSNERGQCEWKNLGSFQGLTLLEVKLIGPGKRHQIRAGLAALGHPIAGDPVYGRSGSSAFFGLHSRSLAWDGHKIQAEPPPSWKKFLEGLPALQ
jgi:23S rRNA pseudouridine1911/1915/1917 synthase